jgi:SAM-dependent methyltransferase
MANNSFNPFFTLMTYLLSLEDQLKFVLPISNADYEKYFRQHCIAADFPFAIATRPVCEEGNIVEFINRFDLAHLTKMIDSVFVSLIRFLVQQRGTINLLDFGTGQTCGMYGENGRFLFEQGRVDIDNIYFFGIDDLHEPQGSIFKKSAYLKCNILSFRTDKRFDLITGHHVLEHCYNWEEVLVHIVGLLKKDGYLYLSFPRLGGFYDTAYRLMSPADHCASFDIPALKVYLGGLGVDMCLSDIYVDPNNRFDWICNIYPGIVSKELADSFYDLCVILSSKLPLGWHHYGHYVVCRKK